MIRGTRSGLTVQEMLQSYGQDSILGEHSFFGELATLGYPIYRKVFKFLTASWKIDRKINVSGCYWLIPYLVLFENTDRIGHPTWVQTAGKPLEETWFNGGFIVACHGNIHGVTDAISNYFPDGFGTGFLTIQKYFLWQVAFWFFVASTMWRIRIL